MNFSKIITYCIYHFQGDILRAEGREEQEAIAAENERKRLEDEKRHKDAFVDTIKGVVLLKNLKTRKESEERKIEKLILSKESGALSLKQQYEKDISSLGDQIHHLGMVLNKMLVIVTIFCHKNFQQKFDISKLKI